MEMKALILEQLSRLQHEEAMIEARIAKREE
jgi:hypothetical protein